MAANDEIPTINSGSQVSDLDSQPVRLVGTYRTQRLGGHAIIARRPDGSIERRQKAAFVVLSDKAQVSLAGRPEEEMQRMDGQPVEVTGTLWAAESPGPSDVAAPNPLPFLTEIRSVQAL